MSCTDKGPWARAVVFLLTVALLFFASFKTAHAVTYAVSGKLSKENHNVVIPFPASASTTFLCNPSKPSCLTFCLDIKLAAPASVYKNDELMFTLNNVRHSPSSSNAVQCYWTCGCEFYSNLAEEACQYPLSQLQLVIPSLPAGFKGTVHALFSQIALKQDDTDKVSIASPQAFSLEAMRECVVEPADRFTRYAIPANPSKTGSAVPSCTSPDAAEAILYEVYATQTFSSEDFSSSAVLHQLANSPATESVSLKCARRGVNPTLPPVMRGAATTVLPAPDAPIISTTTAAAERPSGLLKHAKVTLSVPKPTMELSSTRSAYTLPRSEVYAQLCHPGTPYAITACVEAFKSVGKCSIQINDGPLIGMRTLTSDVASEKACYMLTSCDVWEALEGAETCFVDSIRLTLDHDADAIWRLTSVEGAGPELKVLFSGVQMQLNATEEIVSRAIEHDSNTAVFIPAGHDCKGGEQKGEMFQIQVTPGSATAAAPKCISSTENPDLESIVGSVYHIAQGFPVNKDFEPTGFVGRTVFECSAALHFANVPSSFLVLVLLSLFGLYAARNSLAAP